MINFTNTTLNYKSTPNYYTGQSQHDLTLPSSTSVSGQHHASEFGNRLSKNIREIEKINCFETEMKERLLASL